MASFDYDQVRTHIQDGDVVFMEGSWSRPFEALVMFATRSRFSHVGVAFSIGEGAEKRWMLVESQFLTKRRIVNLSFYDDQKMVVVPGPISWGEIRDEALKRVGKARYGNFQALYIGVRELLLKYLNIRIAPLNLPNDVCSEFVAKLYKLPETAISPQVLFEQLTKVQKEKGS